MLWKGQDPEHISWVLRGMQVRGGSIASTSSTVVSMADAVQSAFLAVRPRSRRSTPILLPCAGTTDSFFQDQETIAISWYTWESWMMSCSRTWNWPPQVIP